MKKKVTGDMWLGFDYESDEVVQLSDLLLINSYNVDELDKMIELIKMYKEYRKLDDGDSVLWIGQSKMTMMREVNHRPCVRPSAVVKRDDEYIAIASDENIGDTDDRGNNISVVRPIEGGKIVDKEAAKYLVSKMLENDDDEPSISKLLIIVPAAFATEEFELLRQIAHEAGAKEVRFLYRPLAEAICFGFNIYEPEAKMIVHVGGGTTEISVITLGGIVVNKTIPVAGDAFTEDIRAYICEKFDVLIDKEEATKIKKEVSHFAKYSRGRQRSEKREFDCFDRGKNVRETLAVSYKDLLKAMDKSIKCIKSAVIEVLAKIPPELVFDISNGMIILTGGSSGVLGVKEEIQKRLRAEFLKCDLINIHGEKVKNANWDDLKDFSIVEANDYYDDFYSLMHFDRFDDFLIK